MIRVNPTRPTGIAAAATEPVRAAEAASATAASAVGSAAAPQMTGTVSQVLAGAFERLRGVGANPSGRPVDDSVREAVRETLERQLPTVGEPLRAQLADQISQVLLDDPSLRARLDRLMGSPA